LIGYLVIYVNECLSFNPVGLDDVLKGRNSLVKKNDEGVAFHRLLPESKEV
jgi:hypothetical protein